MPLSRRTLLGTAAAAAALSKVREGAGAPARYRSPSPAPTAKAVERAVDLLQKGNDPLDAAIAGVNIVEDDPET
jgi:N4-(beta-N-acetylglucosaminyl)-L-asparaginase